MGQGCGKVEISGRNGYIWALCIQRTQTRMRTLCIRRTLWGHVTIGTPMVIFAVLAVFWLLLTVFDDWYTVGTVLVDMWWQKMQKWPLVYQSPHVYQDCTNGVPQCTNRQKQSKYSQNSNNFVTTFWICLVSGCPAYRHAICNRDPFTHFRENWVGTKRETKKQ